MEDSELLCLLQRDAEAGLQQLTQKYGGLIETVVRRILPADRQDAEECAADTLVRIWRDSARLQAAGGTLRGFVIWAARNTAIDRFRQLRRQRGALVDGEGLLEFLPAAQDTGADAAQEMSLRRTEELIRGMPPPDDEISLRRFFLCETVPQIARRLHMNVKAVESRLQRGRQRLREQLQREGVTPE